MASYTSSTADATTSSPSASSSALTSTSTERFDALSSKKALASFMCPRSEATCTSSELTLDWRSPTWAVRDEIRSFLSVVWRSTSAFVASSNFLLKSCGRGEWMKVGDNCEMTSYVKRNIAHE